MNDNLFPFFHPLDDGVSSVEGDHRPIIGMGGAYNGNRKTFSLKCLTQLRFTGDFISGIVPVGIMEKGRLRNGQALRGLLVDRSRTDKHILCRLILE